LNTFHFHAALYTAAPYCPPQNIQSGVQPDDTTETGHLVMTYGQFKKTLSFVLKKLFLWASSSLPLEPAGNKDHTEQ
jgi:hypothetical protein